MFQFLNKPLFILNHFPLMILKSLVYRQNHTRQFQCQRIHWLGISIVILKKASKSTSYYTSSTKCIAMQGLSTHWSPLKMIALDATKREQYFEELDAIDQKDSMNLDTSKWVHISQLIMAIDQSPCMCNSHAYKVKWNRLIPYYKEIIDFHTLTGLNTVDYWVLSTSKYTTDGLSKNFSQNSYNQIHKQYGSKPQIQYPHTLNLLVIQDENYPRIYC